MNVDDYEAKLRKERSPIPAMVVFVVLMAVLAALDIVFAWVFWAKVVQ